MSLKGKCCISPSYWIGPAWPGEASRCKQSCVAMATSSSTFNFSVYEGGNYFLLYVCIVYNSNNVAPTSQVRQLLVINEQLDIFIYLFPS